MTNLQRSHWVFAILLSALALLAASMPAHADARGDLKARFKARYADLEAVKTAGKVGETFEGYVEAVAGNLDAKERELVDTENSDRRELYKMIAESEQISPEQVASMNAQRRFDREPAGRFLKGKDGVWKKKG